MISLAHWIGQYPPYFLTAYAFQGCSQMVQLFSCFMLYECVTERGRKRATFCILPIDGVFRAQLPLFELINYLLMSSVYHYSSLIWIVGHNFVVQKNIVSWAVRSWKRRCVDNTSSVMCKRNLKGNLICFCFLSSTTKLYFVDIVFRLFCGEKFKI